MTAGELLQVLQCVNPNTPVYHRTISLLGGVYRWQDEPASAVITGDSVAIASEEQVSEWLEVIPKG